MNKIRRTTAAELSTAALRQQILNREILPGSRVTEDAMARELGISRATVRQALNSLVLEGLLVRNPASRVLEVLSLDAEDVKEIYQARRVLEIAGVGAARNAPEEARLELKNAVEQMAEAVHTGNVIRFVEADGRCHALTVGFLKSQILSQTHASLMGRLRLAMTHLESDENATADGLVQHQEFCDLILSGKINEAAQNLATRLNIAEEQMLKSLITPPPART